MIRNSIDLAGLAGVNAPTFKGERIDYIFATPGIQVLDVDVLPAETSDRRPIVPTVRSPG